jgi:hypothetical protein
MLDIQDSESLKGFKVTYNIDRQRRCCHRTSVIYNVALFSIGVTPSGHYSN